MVASVIEMLMRLLLMLLFLFMSITSTPEYPASILLPPANEGANPDLVPAPDSTNDNAGESVIVQPDILHFSVTPLNVVEGELITVSWDVTGVESVQIGLIYYGIPRHGEPMVYGSAGSVTLTAPQGVRGFDVVLSDFVNRYQERVISQTIQVEVTCRFEWFGETFTDNEFCPEALRTVSGQYQAFEGGYMVTWQDSPYVWLYLYGSGFHERPPTYTGMLSPGEVQAVLAVPPPDGLFSPGDAFANIWSAPWERENLGWALAPQQNYTMTLQPSVHHGATLLTLPDGAVVSVSRRWG